MAGHSKWANIQHRKRAQDSKRAKIFTKLIREITVAVQTSGPDPSNNPRLRDAIVKAKAATMTGDTIQRAIKRGTGEGAGEDYQAISYEGYGPAGVAIYVECLSDNRNRTVGEVRHAFTKCGGNLGTDGSVAYLFTQKGQILLAPGINEDHVMEIALEQGAEDVIVQEDGSAEVVTTVEQFEAVKNALAANNIEIAEAEITRIASTQVAITDKDTAEKMLRLIDMLEDLDDVQNVYSNADIAEDLLNELS